MRLSQWRTRGGCTKKAPRTESRSEEAAILFDRTLQVKEPLPPRNSGEVTWLRLQGFPEPKEEKKKIEEFKQSMMKPGLSDTEGTTGAEKYEFVAEAAGYQPASGARRRFMARVETHH